MATVDNLRSIDSLVGMTILSRATGNKLGNVYDLIVDPVKGLLLGLAARGVDETLRVVEGREIYSFGADAVMVNTDDSVLSLENTHLTGVPLAKKNIAGARIVTESGTLLGQVANIYLYAFAPHLLFYEVRESLLDKLLGRALFIPASAGQALSNDAERIVVPDDTPKLGADSLESLARGHLAPFIEDETVLAANRPPTPLHAFSEGTIEISESSQMPVVEKRARVVEEVEVNRDVRERTETVRDTLRRSDVEVERLEE